MGACVNFTARGLSMAICALLLSGCSFQQTLDQMVSTARQAEIVRTAQALCADPAALQTQMEQSLWAQSQPLFPQLPTQCPETANVAWRLTDYRFNTSVSTGTATDRRETAIVIAGNDAGPWSQVQLNFAQAGTAPAQIIGWNVTRTATRPPSLTFIDNWDNVRAYVAIGILLVSALIIGLIVWFVRRRRRKGRGLTDA